jgi:hypothetical protein
VRLARPTSLGILAAALSACAGNGAGLDQNGRPFTDPNAPLTAEFASLQSHVFTPYCTGCHAGAGAPLGLRLTEDASYAALVNQASVEQPSLKRVAPGNPNASYLLQKVSGTAAVGGRMPLGGPPLPEDAIAAIRQWIADGAAAPRNVTPSSLSTLPAQLAAVYPVEAAHVDFEMGAIVVTSNFELDATTLSAHNVRLLRSGGDRGFDDGNEVEVEPLSIEVRSGDPTIFAITPPARFAPDRYRLVIAGTGPVPVRDRASQPIDGDGDLHAGGDFVLLFDIDSEVRQ